jgi:hypothetical protein
MSLYTVSIFRYERVAFVINEFVLAENPIDALYKCSMGAELAETLDKCSGEDFDAIAAHLHEEQGYVPSVLEVSTGKVLGLYVSKPDGHRVNAYSVFYLQIDGYSFHKTVISNSHLDALKIFLRAHKRELVSGTLPSDVEEEFVSAYGDVLKSDDMLDVKMRIRDMNEVFSVHCVFDDSSESSTERRAW